MEHAFMRKGIERKGQASIEFMLLIVLILLYIQTIIQPMIVEGTNSLDDTMRVGRSRFAAEKLANTINYVNSLGGEAKSTVSIFIPDRSRIYCDDTENEIYFISSIDSKIAQCGLDGTPECDKSFGLMSGITMQCNFIPYGSYIDSNATGGNPVKATVERLPNGTIIVSNE